MKNFSNEARKGDIVIFPARLGSNKKAQIGVVWSVHPTMVNISYKDERQKPCLTTRAKPEVSVVLSLATNKAN